MNTQHSLTIDFDYLDILVKELYQLGFDTWLTGDPDKPTLTIRGLKNGLAH